MTNRTIFGKQVAIRNRVRSIGLRSNSKDLSVVALRVADDRCASQGSRPSRFIYRRETLRVIDGFVLTLQFRYTDPVRPELHRTCMVATFAPLLFLTEQHFLARQIDRVVPKFESTDSLTTEVWWRVLLQVEPTVFAKLGSSAKPIKPSLLRGGDFQLAHHINLAALWLDRLHHSSKFDQKDLAIGAVPSPSAEANPSNHALLESVISSILRMRV